MAKGFQGKIALDIRDAEPDWAPYLAPKAPAGAPNVLVIEDYSEVPCRHLSDPLLRRSKDR